MIPKFIELAMNNKPITLYGDGLQTRTFCYVSDNIDACVKAINDDSCVNKVLNIGSDKEVTIKSLAQEIITLTNSSSEIIHLPALKEGDMTRRCPDITKMKKVLGRDLLSLKDGLTKLLAYYENRK